MSIKFFIGLVVSSMIFTSCGQKKEVTYSKHSSADNTYSVEYNNILVYINSEDVESTRENINTELKNKDKN